MKAFIFLFFPLFLLSGMLNAQAQNLTYTMKLTRVYSDFPINQDSGGPDLRYRIRGRLTGLGGTEIPASVDVWLPNEERFGWIELDQPVTVATGSISAAGPPIDLCNTGIGVIMDDLSAWESDNPAEDGTATAIGGDDAYVMLYNLYPIGAPEKNAPSSGVSGTFQVLSSTFTPGSHFGYEFEVTYVLENGIRDVIIAGSAIGNPVTSLCEGGAGYLKADVGPRFTGGKYLYEVSADGNPPWIFVGMGDENVPAVRVPVDRNKVYRASLQNIDLPPCLSDDDYEIATLSNVTIRPSFVSDEIIVESTPPTCEGNDDGTITVLSINGLAPEQEIRLQLQDGPPSTNFLHTTTAGELPYLFENVPGGTYTVDAALWERNDEGNFTPQCGVASRGVTLAAPPAMASFTAVPEDPACGGMSGTVAVTYNGTNAFYAALYTSMGVEVVASVPANDGQNHLFSNVAPGNYYVEISDGAFCVRESMPFIINDPIDPAGGSFAPLDGSFNLDCPADMATFNFTPASGTGENLVSLTRLTSGQQIPVFTDEIVNGGNPYQYDIRGGDYELTFERTDNGCSDTQTFTVTSNQSPVSIILLEATPPLNCDPNSGTLELEVSGGTQPYAIRIVGLNVSPATTTPTGNTVEYLYNNVPSGDNLIEITDANGCVEQLALAVPQEPGGFSLTIDNGASKLNLTCNGDTDGVVEFIGSGMGTLQYKIIEINDNFSAQTRYENLPAGQYTGVLKDATCETNLRFEVKEPIAIEILSVDVVPRDYCPDPNFDIMMRVAVPVERLACVNGQPGTDLVNSLFFAEQIGEFPYDVEDAPGFVEITSSQCTGILEITLLNRTPGNYDIAFGFLDELLIDAPLICPSEILSLAPEHFIERPAPFAEIIGKTDPSCPGAYDGSVTVRYGGGDPNGSFELRLNGGYLTNDPNNPGSLIATDFPGIPAPVIQSSYTASSTLTFTGLPDLAEFGVEGTDYYYYLQLLQIQPGTSCRFYSIPPDPPLADRVILNAPASLTFDPQLIKRFECDGTGGIVAVTTPSGGTPPYQYKVSGNNTGEPEETIQDFSAETTFNLSHKDFFRITMRDAQGCTQVSGQFGIGYEPTIDFGVTFTPDPIIGCPPAPGEFLGGELRVNGGLGETTYTFSTVEPGGTGGVGRPFPVTTADSIIELSGMLAGEVTVFMTNTATGESCAQATFTYEAPPLQLTTTTTLNQGESCLGSADGVIKILAAGGEAPFTFINRGVVTTFQAGEIPELTIEGVTSGLRTVLLQDANGCQLIHQVEIAPSPGVITIGISTDPAFTCLDDNDGRLTITPQGGTGPLQLTWLDPDGFTVTLNPNESTTRTGLSRLEYPLEIVDANGCSASFSPIPGGRDQLVAEIVDLVQPGCLSTGSFRVNIAQNSLPASATFSASINNQGLQNDLTFSDLGPGTYSVLVIDDTGCPQANELTVTLTVQNNDVIIAGTPTDATCNGGDDGQIVAQATGGTPPYQYSLNGATPVTDGTFTGLTALTYTIEAIDAAGCTSTSGPIIVGEPDPVEGLWVSATNSCAGGSNGSVTIASTGGIAPFSYRVEGGTYGPDPIFTGLAPGAYQFQVRDAMGCESALIGASVGQFLLFSVEQGPIQNASCNTADGSSTVNVMGGNDGYTFAWPDGQTGQTAVGLIAGNYDVTVTSENDCSQNFTATVGSLTGPIVQGAATGNDACESGIGTITLFVGGGTAPYNYAWSDDPNRDQASATSLFGGEYIITVTDDAGCSTQTTITIFTTDGISLNLESSTPSSCGLNNGTATVINTGGIEPVTYAWSHDPTADGPTVTNLPGGIDVVVTATSNNGCTDQLTITAGNSSAVGMTGTTVPTSCGQDNGQITVAPIGGNAPFTYTWSHTGTLLTGMATNLAVGDYSVTLTDTDGCSVERVFAVNSSSPLSLEINNVTPSDCSVNNGSVNVAVIGNTNSVTYSWSHDAGISGQSASGLAAGVYSITVTEDGTGCTATLDVTVEGSPGGALLQAITRTSTTCGLDNGVLEVLPAFGNAPFSYEWSHTDTLTIGTGINLAAGIYGVTATDADGCTSVGSYLIEEGPLPQVSLINSSPTACGQADGSLSVAPAFLPEPTFTWSHDPNLDAPMAGNLAGGDYTVTVTSTNGCSAVATFTVASTGFNDVVATGTNASCVEGNGTVNVTVLNGTPPFTYNWEHAPGENVSGFIGLNSGTYNVTITDGSGCSGQTSVVVPAPTLPTLSVAFQSGSCNGVDDGSITLAGTNGLAPFEYRLVGGTYASSPTFSGLAPGDYQFQMSAADGCESELLDVIIEPTITINTLIAEDEICNGGNGRITVQGVGGTTPYTYAWSDEPARTVSFVDTLSAGSYTITVTDAVGCSNEVTIVLSSTQGVSVSLVSQTPTACGQNNGSATVTTTGGTEPVTYAWSHDPTADGPTVTNLPASISTVMVTSANGCTDELVISISSIGGIALVNGFAQGTTCGLDNGTISASPVGGNAPFTYTWSHTDTLTESPATNLAPGDYTVTITDADGCSQEETLTIVPSTNPLSVQVISQEPSDCSSANGNITLETIGNVNGIRYDWSHDPNLNGNFAFGLAAGDYSVTVTESGPRCSVILNYTIAGTPGGAILQQVNLTNTTCGLDNGILEVLPNGGNAPFTYQWSHTNTLTTGTATDLAGGNYSITATDADGCTSMGTFTINGSATPTLVELSGGLPADCGQRNGRLNVQGFGLFPQTYTWSHDPNLTGQVAENLAGGDYSVTVTGINGCTAEATFTVENVGFLTVDVERINSLCEDGNGIVNLTVSNGIPPFTYDWAHAPGENVPGFTDLNAGLYQVTVTDSTGCSRERFASVNIDEPPALTVFTQVHTRCGLDGGFLYVNASGGLRPYVFNWAEIADQTSGQTNGFDGIGGLAAGDYNLTVTDANGCMVSGTYTIDASAPVDVSVTNQTNPTGGMNNGSITIATTGFVPPLTYFWSHDDNLDGPIAANLPAGIYTIGVQDVNSCYDEVTVVLNSGLIAELINVNNPVCTNNTGTAEVNVLTGTAPYSYAWSHAPGMDVPSFDNLPGGGYTVRVSDATGATFDLSFELEFEGGFSSIFPFSQPASCGLDNGTLELFPNNGEFPYTYNWADFPGLNENRLTDLAIGDYAVTVTDGEGCSLSRVFTVEAAPDPELIIDYLFQPTGGMANGEIGVETSGFTDPITYSWSHDPNINSPFLEDLPAGTYTLTVTGANGCTEMITINLDGNPVVIAEVTELRDAVCTDDNGEAAIRVNVGQSPYTYAWSHAPGEDVRSFDNLASGDYMVTVGDDAGATTVVSFTVGLVSGPTAIIATANEGTTCGESNATLTIAPVGGTAFFEYEWADFPSINNPTLTNLSPGDYTVTIYDDNDCSFSETFTVAGSAIPAVSLNQQVDPSGGLANGSISITTAGFTAPLTYQWSHDAGLNAPIAENLAAGSFTVTVTGDDFCSDELTVVLTEGLTAEIINLSNSVCTDDNGAAEVNVLSGVPPFSYEWSHAPGIDLASFSDLSQGNYMVTVTDDNGATFGLDFLIGLERGPTSITSTVNQGVTCGEINGALTVSPTGGTAPYTYSWEDFPTINGPSLTGLTAGDYALTITDGNNCFATETFTVSSSEGPSAVTATSNMGTTCGEDNGVLTVSPTGGVPPFVYQWGDFPAVNAPSLSNLSPGDYALTITDANGCIVMETFTIDDSVFPLVSLVSSTDPDPGLDNGVISVRTSGMAMPLTYDWSHDPTLNAPLAEGLANGTYTVIVTGAIGCTDELTIVLDGLDPIVAEVVELTDAICTDDNGTATVNVITGIAPFSYAWPHAPGQDVTNFTDLSGGDYTVVVSDAVGVTLELSFSIAFIDGPTAIIAGTHLNTICGLDNGFLNVSPLGGTGPYTYAWSHDVNLTDSEARDLAAGDYTVTITDANGCSISETFTIGASDAPEIMVVNQSDPTCGETNGSIELSQTGLAAPITVAWSHDPDLTGLTATNLTAGTYELILTGSLGCTASISVSLTGQEAISTTLTNLGDAICDNDSGTAAVEITSGTAPFSYSWNHAPGEDQASFDDLVAGDYSVTITDANGCFEVQTFSIGFISGPTGIETTQLLSTICGLDNGLLDVSPLGGTGPYTYTWSHDVNLTDSEARDLAAGDYTVTITDDNGCTISETFTIGASDAPEIMVVNQSDPTCGETNGSIELSQTGLAAPITVAWSHDPDLTGLTATNLTAGTYELILTGSLGCTASISVSLTGQEAISTTLTNVGDAICDNDSGTATVDVTSGTAPFAFSWSHAPGEDQPSFDDLAAGDYTVTITDANGCFEVQTFIIGFIPGPTGIETTQLLSTICGFDNGLLDVSPLGGTGPYTFAWSHDVNLTDSEARDLAAGDYTVTITDANGCTISETFTIGASDAPEIMVVNQSDPTCGETNGSIELSITGLAAPITAVWSHDPDFTGLTATNLSPDTYEVTLNGSLGCTANISVSLAGQEAISTTLTNLGDAICDNDSGTATVDVTSGTAPFAFSWSHAPGEDQPSFDNLAGGDYTVTITDANGCFEVQTFSIGFIPGPTGMETTLLLPTICGLDNGLLDVSPLGGTGPYTYAWSHDVNLTDSEVRDLAGGDYTVTITDANGCTISETFTIGASDAPEIMVVNQSDPTCGETNGSIELSITGLAAPITAVWSHDPDLTGLTATNLTADTYEVLLTGSLGCTANISVSLAGQEAISTTLTNLGDAICDNDSGTATVDVTSGTAPFAFSWSHAPGEDQSSFDDLVAGDYSVTITDANGCFEVQTFSIDFIPGPTGIETTQFLATICGLDNGLLDVSPQGGNGPYTYAWSHDLGLEGSEARDLAAGDYTVTITDANGCTISETYNIEESEMPTAEIVEIGEASCGQANGLLRVVSTNLMVPLTYEWSHDGSLDAPLAENLLSGNYGVTITGAQGCTAEAQASVSNLDGPTISLFSIESNTCTAADGSITISYDGGGTAPFTYTWSHDNELNNPQADDLIAGTYGVTITDATGCKDALLATVTAAFTTLLSNLSTAPASCAQNDGTATAILNSGVPPFTYAWSHDASLNSLEATNVPAGDHTLTITDANGCFVVEAFTILTTEGPTEISTVLQLATICGLDNGILQVAAVGGSSPYTYAWSHDGTLASDEASDLPPGDYTVTITDANSCTISTTLAIGESDVATAAIAAQTDPSCNESNGSITVITAGMTEPLIYEWDHDGTLNAATAEGLGAGNYEVFITDNNGCTASTSTSLNAGLGLIASVINRTNTRCEDGNGAATIEVADGSAPITYAWSHAPGQNVDGFTNLAAGDYSVTVSNVNGCAETLTFSINLIEGPSTIEANSLQASTCGLQNGSLSVGPTGGTGPYVYSWADFPGLNSGELTDLSGGEYALTVTDANGCSVSEVFIVGTSETPAASVGDQTNSNCGQSDGSATMVTSGLAEPLTFIWSHDAGLNAATAEGLAPADYAVTVTGANGCTISTSLTIGVNDEPTAAIAAQTDPVCSPNNGSITVTTSGMTEPLVYAWEHDGTLNAATADGLSAGDYEVTITDLNGCTATASTSLNEGARFSASVINLTDTRCENDNGVATIEVADGAAPFTYAWSHAPGQSTDGFTDLAAGDYSVSVSDANGCSETLTFSINLIEGPTAIETNSLQATTCGFQNGSLNVTPTGGTGPYTYVWDDFLGLNSGELNDLAGGDYALTVIDANGCSVSKVFIVGTSETPTASVGNQIDSNCGQSNGTATINTTGLAEPLSYAWSHDGGLNAATAEGLAAGNYVVTITGTNGCTAVSDIMIGNTDGPMISLATAVNGSCGTANGSISTNYEGGGTAPLTYTWSHDSNLNAANAEGLGAGTYVVTITDVNGCSDALSVDLIDLTGPENLTAASLVATTCGESNGALTVEVTGGTAPFTYEWSHDATITGDRTTELDGGTYLVIVTDANGCSLSNTFNVPSSMGLVITADEVIGANCNMENGSILISVANATGELTYNWSHDPALNTPMLTGLSAGNYMVTVTDEVGCSTEDMIIVESLDNPASFTITTSPSNCEDGQGRIDVTIIDGLPPYNYLWSHDNTLNAPVATGLTVGDYNVVVSDVLGCQVLLEASVVLVEGPEATVVTSEPGCLGATNGSLTALPTGGVTPYTFEWSNAGMTESISDVAAGDYSVTITDANGCTTTVDAMLADGPLLVITLLDSVPPSCAELADGRLEVEASGGSAPYSFSWSEGTNAALAEGLSAGVTYSVTVTSAEGCMAEMSYSMPNVLPLSLPIPADTTLCQDDIWALDLTAYTNSLVTGPNGFSSNEPVVLIDEAGTYTVTATLASGCTGSIEVIVNFTGQTFVAGMVLPSEVVVGDSIVVLETSWPAPESIAWIFDRSGARQVAQEQNQYWFIFDEVGEYNLSLLASFGGCDDLITKGLTVHADSTSIPSIGLTRSGIEDVVISPNPNDGIFSAEVTLSSVDRVFLNLYNLDGTSINRQEDAGSSNYTFNYDLNLEAGSYLLLVQTGSARRTVVIIVSD